MQFRTQLMFLSVITSVLTVCVEVGFYTTVSRDEQVDSESQSKALLLFSMTNTGSGAERRSGVGWGVSEMVVVPTLVVTVRRGFPSDDALLGISFRTMATVLSAALESFPYNSEINNDVCQDSLDNFWAPVQGILQQSLTPCDDGEILWGPVWGHTTTSNGRLSTRLWQWGERDRELLHNVGDRSQTLMSMVVHSGAHLLLMMTVDHRDLAQCMADEYSWLRLQLTVLIYLI